MRCNNCYATGYRVWKVKADGNTYEGKIINQKCKRCDGKGYIEFKE